MMKIITWNIRGLNGRSKKKILRKCIKSENLDILLLQETKREGSIAEETFRSCWRHCNFTYTNSKGEVGGLAILWNPSTIILEPTFSIVGTLTAKYKVIGSSKEGVLTNAYGPQLNQEKDHFVNSLAYIITLRG
jgi:exonuclease III